MRIKKEKQIEYINLWKESGLTKRAFCQEMGLSYHTFLAWKKRLCLDNRGISVEKSRIVPVRIIQNEEDGTYRPYVVVRFQSCSLRIMSGFPQAELKKNS